MLSVAESDELGYSIKTYVLHRNQFIAGFIKIGRIIFPILQNNYFFETPGRWKAEEFFLLVKTRPPHLLWTSCDRNTLLIMCLWNILYILSITKLLISAVLNDFK